jgi:hypothetical protein
MSIAFDAVSSVNSASATSHTLSHTTSGSNRALVVGAAGFGGSSNWITSITYNGVTMTDGAVKADEPAAGLSTQLFYLENPSSGTNNVVVNLSTSKPFGITAASYTGVKQTSAKDGGGTNGSTTTTNTVNVTTGNANSWVVGFWWINQTPTSVVSPAVLRNSFPSSGDIILADRTTTTANTYSISASGNTSGRTAGSAIGLKEETVVASNSNFLMFM